MEFWLLFPLNIKNSRAGPGHNVWEDCLECLISECLTSTPRLTFHSSVLLMCTLNAAMMVQVLGSLSPTWESWIGFPAPGKAWLRPGCEDIWGVSQQMTDLSLCLYLSPYIYLAFKLLHFKKSHFCKYFINYIVRFCDIKLHRTSLILVKSMELCMNDSLAYSQIQSPCTVPCK